MRTRRGRTDNDEFHSGPNPAHDVDPALIFPGPVALVAGPGSGKTSRLALRIQNLVLERKVDPATITVITFTREAARNMKQRITPPAKKGMPDYTLPLDQHPSSICTMHSLGQTIIAEEAKRLNIRPDFRLLPPQMREVIFEDAARLCRKDGHFGRTCADRKAKSGSPVDELQRLVFLQYDQILRASNAIDYDDQIILACRILREHQDVRAAWRTKATHLLVDEFQDINEPQLELITLLAGNPASGLFVVGDDDQSIYSFRGSNPDYIREFPKHFAGGRIVAIPDCYRCQPHVINAAHSFIGKFNAN